MADGSEARLDSSIIGRLEICGRRFDHTFLVLRTLGHDALLGMDILLRLNLDVSLTGRVLRPGKNDCNSDLCTVESTVVLAPNIDEEEQRLEEFITQEMDKFEENHRNNAVTKA